MAEFKQGDRVRWQSHGGEAVGMVERKITADTEAAGRRVRASKDEPQYLVKSERSLFESRGSFVLGERTKEPRDARWSLPPAVAVPLS